MTDLTNRPLKVFLCHASSDKPIVREIYRQLNTEEWIDVWLDELKLLPGQEWDMEIEKAVEESDIVVVCLSTRSVDKEGYVQKELRFVLNIADEKPEGSIFVIPLRLDDCSVPRRLRHWQWVDYFPENQRRLTYERLLESLRVRARKLGIPFKGSESKSDEFKHEETTKQQGQLLQSQPVDATNNENYANHISSSLPEHKSYEQRSVNAGPNARLIRVVLGIFVLLALIFSVWAIPLL